MNGYHFIGDGRFGSHIRSSFKSVAAYDGIDPIDSAVLRCRRFVGSQHPHCIRTKHSQTAATQIESNRTAMFEAHLRPQPASAIQMCRVFSRLLLCAYCPAIGMCMHLAYRANCWPAHFLTAPRTFKAFHLLASDRTLAKCAALFARWPELVRRGSSSMRITPTLKFYWRPLVGELSNRDVFPNRADTSAGMQLGRDATRRKATHSSERKGDCSTRISGKPGKQHIQPHKLSHTVNDLI